MSNELLLPNGSFGYRIDVENRPRLEATGAELSQAMKAFADAFPVFNINTDPASILRILNQLSQGACQGHALALIFSICFFLATGRWLDFSRAAGYYLSQRHDGIRGDNGSTLSGGQWVATEHGMCTEADWRYPSSYDNHEPAHVPYLYKLRVTKPFQTAKELLAWIDLGLPVQTGMAWNSTCQNEIVSNYRALPGSGGHSTVFWLRATNGNINMPNSWGKAWNGDGINEWTESSIAAAVADKNNTFIGYAPDGMLFPPQAPLE